VANKLDQFWGPRSVLILFLPGSQVLFYCSDLLCADGIWIGIPVLGQLVPDQQRLLDFIYVKKRP
jgi:hypothetical protein